MPLTNILGQFMSTKIFIASTPINADLLKTPLIGFYQMGFPMINLI